MNRVVVIGSSASGKTAVSRQLAASLDVPLLELDAIFHQADWGQVPEDQFRATVDEFTAVDRWVVDGNYTSHGMREILWPRADTVVWLDLPRSVVMRQVIRRTLRRMTNREELWNANREPWTNLYSLDPEKNIVLWAWTRFAGVTVKYETCMTDGSWSHAVVHRLRTRADVTAFLGLPLEDSPIVLN